MRKNQSTILLLLVFLIGLSLLLYPTVSDWWNSFHQSQAIAGYAEAVAELDDLSYDRYWADARAYNAALPDDTSRFLPTEEKTEQYENLLNISGNGIMGYIEIPAIGVSLPIYHGVEDTVLQIAIGHIEGSSLPVGGEGTHCVVSGHRGLPSAKLFTDLDKLAEGDTFLLRVLDEVLTYEVDQIHIVEPDEVDLLAVEAGQDLCTLVTCTPYGINTHRMLIRGHRIETPEDALYTQVPPDALQIDPLLIAPLVAAPLLVLLLAWMLGSGRKHSKPNRKQAKKGGNPGDDDQNTDR